MNDVAELRALKARLAALEGQSRPAEMSPETAAYLSRQGSVMRDGHGNVIKSADTDNEEAYRARNAARAAEAKAEREAYDAKCRRGLPSGLFRDPCGIVRRANGEAASREEIDGRPEDAPAAVQRRVVEEGRRRAHHDFLEANGLLDGVEGSPESAARAANEKE